MYIQSSQLPTQTNKIIHKNQIKSNSDERSEERITFNLHLVFFDLRILFAICCQRHSAGAGEGTNGDVFVILSKF